MGNDKFELSEIQKRAYNLLESACEYSLRRGTICLVGDFQSGKTTIAKYFLMKKYDNIDKYYINMNLLLLERLSKESVDLSIQSKIKAKTRLIMAVAIDELLEKHFKEHSLLVLDSIEIIYPYNLNPIPMISRYTNDGKICILCVPENEKYIFDFSWGNCEIIRL